MNKLNMQGMSELVISECFQFCLTKLSYERALKRAFSAPVHVASAHT